MTSTSVNTIMTIELLDLPKELRLEIYAFALTEVVTNNLYIRKYDADHRWRLCLKHNNKSPGILLTSKLVSIEAIGVLHTSCNSPKLVIDSQRTFLHGIIRQPDDIENRKGNEVKDVESVRPILRAVRELYVEVKAIETEHFCVLLVRWLRAVLNHRDTMLVSLKVNVHVQDGLSMIHERTGIYEALYEVYCQTPVEIWAVKRQNRSDCEGPPLGERLLPLTVLDSNRKLSEKQIWMDLQQAKTSYYVTTLTPAHLIIVDPNT